ncbi:DUF4349 domain-containing protein [Janibacter alkaliphilus]|uniref:DUF4349 domain-containing protein n=1 Tax=Janibacter alkaliphilus TaxID=1069963 RepID=A0A852X3I8_9MICO|nr:DUF4349 domain-containing protein [Janibacter alkaliphilus]NYG37932.1 hypothetical protein [Janibacter alkaliphilus]
MSSTRRDTSTKTAARADGKRRRGRPATRAARARRVGALLAGLAAAGLVAAGCAGGSDDSSEAYSTTQAAPSAESEAGTEEGAGDASSAQGSAAEDSTADGSGADDSAGSGSDAAGQDAATVAAQSARKLARSGSLDLEVEDVTRTSARVRSVADRAGGWVSQEDSSSRADDAEDGDDVPDGVDAYPSEDVPGAWSEITVQVPASALEKSMDDLAELGTVTHRTTETEDVTAAHTDAKTRVETLTRSTERLRELIEDSDDLEQIVSLESELTTREGELESMTRQLDTLEERTATSPITVSIAEEGADVSTEDEAEETGFVAGLSDGWGAFTGALQVGATVLGALTPFALAGGLVLAPVLWWWRRRPRPATTAPAPTAPAE